MPRPKLRTDAEVLDQALALMRRGGPEALSFGSLAAAAGLSGATLVQRFGSKEGLVRGALLRAWDALDALTDRLDTEAAPGPDGAAEILAGLSSGYGDIDAHADGLRILREDFRDPVLRARGRAWIERLTQALASRVGSRDAAALVPLWQGTVMLWGFAPDRPLRDMVAERVRDFLGDRPIRRARPGPRR
jgi:AcrR family transcriptional regulator